MVRTRYHDSEYPIRVSVQGLPPNWSACAFISGQALIDTTGLLCKVSGVRVTDIEEVKDHSIDEY
jgi:hypothetical protein